MFKRGQEIYTNFGVKWYTKDGEEIDAEPACIRCGRKGLEGGEDACLGHLPGVRAACCGHGGDEGYVAFEDGTIIRFTEATVEKTRPVVWVPVGKIHVTMDVRGLSAEKIEEFEDAGYLFGFLEEG